MRSCSNLVSEGRLWLINFSVSAILCICNLYFDVFTLGICMVFVFVALTILVLSCLTIFSIAPKMVVSS